jgi:hypothetical protein
MDYIYGIEAPAIGTPDSSFKKLLSYNLMLNSGRKFRAERDKKIYILTLVLLEKKFLKETKNHNQPLQVKWSVPKNIKLIHVLCHTDL